MDIITLEKVSKVYRKGFKGTAVSAVSDVTFSVAQNRITGFVGPNGAGKTTTIKMIMGLVAPSRGTIKIRSVDASQPKARQNVAYVSEQPYFYRHLSVAESLRFVSELLDIEKGKIAGEVKRVLDIVELSGKEKLKIREMSKGMQQRLNMACGLLGDPDLLILDEPMSGLDPPARRLFRNLFKRLGNEGKTIFFSTHVLEDIEVVCDDVIVLDGGKLRYTGRVDALLERGYLGSELLVKELGEELQQDLNSRGWNSTINPDDTWMIFVPGEKELMSCQELLHSKGIYCHSIQKRTMPLETLLYGSTAEKNS
ncbi:ABC transporter ATP-binding protein [Chitinispirillales bacterium ANBcel5]|uniref:ABC transporter ATP-binding protein n=1 Tax=Cellulosispirillum alkaliphilum TaxID=3039283 RepID=UPI002A532C9F|nr:ABC transporter ATP-binding protein [Chitinispirillales bacterium ANBcel5]